MYMFMYVCFQWWTWYLFLGQRHGSDWWLVLLSDRRWAVNVSSSKGHPNKSEMLKLQKFYLKNLQLFQSDLLILSVGFRQVNRFQNQARIWIHTYNTHIYKLNRHVCQNFSKPTVYCSIHHKHTPVPMNSTSYCPSTASTLSTRRRVSL